MLMEDLEVLLPDPCYDYMNQPPFVCCCGASFQFLGQITSHKKKNCEWIYVCPHCDRVYKDFEKLTAHKETHDTTKAVVADKKESNENTGADAVGDVAGHKVGDTTGESAKDLIKKPSPAVVDKPKAVTVRPQNSAPANQMNKQKFQKMSNNQQNFMGGRPGMGMMTPQMGMGNYGMNPMMMGNMGMNPGMGQFGPMNPMMMGNFMPYNQFCQPNMMNMMPNMGMPNMNPNQMNPFMGGHNMVGPNMGGFNNPNQMGNFPPPRSNESFSGGRPNFNSRSQGRSSPTGRPISPGRPGDSPPLERRRESKLDKDDDRSNDMDEPSGNYNFKRDRRSGYSGDSDSEWHSSSERGKLPERYTDQESDKDSSFYWARRSSHQDELLSSKRNSSAYYSKPENLSANRENIRGRIGNNYGFGTKRESQDGGSGLPSKMMRPDHRF